MKTSIGLYWFRLDLRLDDNPSFNALIASCDEVICLTVIDSRWFRPGHYQSAHMGAHRYRFLLESLQALDKRLQNVGQKLHIAYGEPLQVIDQCIAAFQVNCIGAEFHPGVYERQQWQRLQNVHPGLSFVQQHGRSVFAPEDLPFAVEDLPSHFTPFRKKVEKRAYRSVQTIANTLPPAPSQKISFEPPPTLPIPPVWQGLAGGESSGQQQLQRYLFESDAIQTYKQTRNGLDGWDFSSKLSAWLALGCLSAVQVASAIHDYEQQRVANESTYWLYFELLWREYFHWYGAKHQSRLFKFDGIQRKKPLTSFWPQRFARWCQGDTPYPIVNACMKQLNATGFMSNRGRQLVASCLVHELNLDWRYGAAYFEQQLVDFDVGSNWGNWQYLAGVGADPRGHRRFDLAKQTQQYDPDQTFIQAWQGEANHAPLDDTDIADWPIQWQ